jgi:hypothetical protein
MSGLIRGASVEIDCSSWSRARDIPNGPPRLRDDFDGLWGLPSLIGKPLQQVLLANSLWKWVFRFLKIARLCEIPFLIENPKSSRLWLTPQAAAIRGWPQASFVVADFCQYGTDYKKPTGLLCYRLPRVAAAAKTCSPVPAAAVIACSRVRTPTVASSPKPPRSTPRSLPTSSQRPSSYRCPSPSRPRFAEHHDCG